ncbi:MAG TPA: potassium transporter TrkA [Spirochaetia bacterium]|nr:MAG: hypothetical protein A2Y41_03355 [Spirochaetes bacterium GWB1_36_13]HCL56619.1 potassium transporter TrkA [Spirochaetia bacterium]
MKKNTMKEKLKYRFDNLMSKGTAALIGWLGFLTVVLILVISTIVWLTGLLPDDFPKILWKSFMHTIDGGTVAGDEGDWSFLFLMLVITLGGIFILSILIGILTSGIEARLDKIRKGRSRVIEEGHTVILGWSEQVFTIIKELSIANLVKKKACIVVMALKDKVEMEEEIREKVGKTGKTKIVCRSGDPIDLTDLEIVSLNQSKSVIVLSSKDEDSDSSVVKTLLAITSHPSRREDSFHIVAEIRDPKNLEIAKIAGKGEAELLLVGDLIARVVAQSCLKEGLSVVYSELLDFEGAEIYFHADPLYKGKKFKEIQFYYKDSTVIGIFNKEGKTLLNPDPDTVLGEKEEIILIAEDSESIFLAKENPYIYEQALEKSKSINPSTQKNIILGWNWRLPIIVRELDKYVPSSSILQLVSDKEDPEKEIKKYCPVLTNQSVSYTGADITDRRVLDELTEESYDNFIILSDDRIEAQKADAKTLMTLLHLREISEKQGKNFSIVTEMMDIKNRNLAAVTKVNDFIISDKLISLLISQISENKALNQIFEELFDAEGNEIYIKPAIDYVQAGTEVNFYTVTESASLKREIPIGYKLKKDSQNADKAYGIVINPDKAQKIVFDINDKIILIAED